jgi:hypothetical protein
MHARGKGGCSSRHLVLAVAARSKRLVEVSESLDSFISYMYVISVAAFLGVGHFNARHAPEEIINARKRAAV